jgi:hypothetical protein
MKAEFVIELFVFVSSAATGVEKLHFFTRVSCMCGLQAVAATGLNLNGQLFVAL